MTFPKRAGVLNEKGHKPKLQPSMRINQRIEKAGVSGFNPERVVDKI
jgi:hypothetical protein